MKRILLFFLMTLLFLCGCAPQSPAPSPNDPSSEGNNGDTSAPTIDNIDTSEYNGVFARSQTLNDPITGVPILDVLLPHGWTVQVQSDWSFVSTVNPCIANIQFTSPDQKATVLIQTAHDYLQTCDSSGLFPHQDYTDRENYIVHLAYKNADQVLDLYFNGIFGTNGTVVSETPIPREVQSILDQTAQTYLNTLVNGINQSGGGYGISAEPNGSEGTISLRRYRYTGSDGKSYLADAVAFCIAAQYISPSYGTYFINTPWTVPAVMVYAAQDEATLEKYRAQYEVIYENSRLRNEFNYVKHVYGSYIRNMVMQKQASSIAAMTEAQAQSYMNNYDSSSYTSDDWANDWSDYIYDRNEYTTADGNILKVGTEFDTVYQNGNEYYFGSQGNSPFGWEALNRN